MAGNEADVAGENTIAIGDEAGAVCERGVVIGEDCVVVCESVVVAGGSDAAVGWPMLGQRRKELTSGGLTRKL